MKRIAGILILPVLLAACGAGPRHLTDAQQALKAQCVAADYQACAEIGHMSREAMGGVSGGSVSSASPAPSGTAPTATVASTPAPTTAPNTAPAMINGEITGAQPIID